MRNLEYEDTQRRVLRHNLQRLTQKQLIERLIDTKLALIDTKQALHDLEMQCVTSQPS